MSGTPTPTSAKVVTTRGLTIGASTVAIGPLVPFIWNKMFPEWPMTAEVAASAAGVVSVFLGFVYAVVYKILLKYGIAP